MTNTRKIIEIDEELCDGCGQCILACAEGALELVNGKAKLVGDLYCDGLGACIGDCPQGALTIIERPADEFDEAAVEDRLQGQGAAPPSGGGCPSAQPVTLPGGGCPSAAPMALPQAEASPGAAVSGPSASGLGHFPIKLGLLGPQAPFLKGSDMVLLADCAAAVYPDLHRDMLPGKAILMGCPKLDDLDAHIQRLAAIVAEARPRRLTVAHMEVPCCGGFVYAAQEAVKRAGTDTPLFHIQIGRDGRVLEQGPLAPAGAGA
jgi:ferredoxin